MQVNQNRIIHIVVYCGFIKICGGQFSYIVNFLIIPSDVISKIYLHVHFHEIKTVKKVTDVVGEGYPGN